MRQKPFTLALTYWVTIILISHFFSPPGYLWTENTISELASQGHRYKWSMQAGLSGFGILIMLATGLAFLLMRKIFRPGIPIAFYGLAILLSGIYCAAPTASSIPYSVSEAKLHSIFATLAGLSLSLGILWRVLNSSTEREKLTHLLFLVAVTGLSVFFGLAENHLIDFGKGVVQRFLYLSGFAWLIYQERVIFEHMTNT